MRKILSAVAVSAVLASCIAAPAAAGHDKVSLKTFHTDQARQDANTSAVNHRVNDLTNVVDHNADVLNANTRAVKADLNRINSEWQKADTKARQRDAAILSLDKPMLSSTDNFGVELGIAHAGGANGIGVSGVARISGNVYGSLGAAMSPTGYGTSYVSRAAIGLAW